MAVSPSQPTQSRPSFYATIRLARLVLNFKERLKSKIKLRHSLAETFGSSQIKSFQAHAYKDLDHALRSQNGFPDTAVQDRKYGQTTGSDLGVSELLNELDAHAKPGQLRLSAIAAQDQLFLEHDIHHFAICRSSEIKHTLDTTTLLLARLHQVEGSNVEGQNDDLHFAKYNANLEHLLRCLQQAALEALIHLSLKLMEAEALRWNHCRRRLAQIIEGWFAEWPNGRHPLSTTWPWNIKPSLVILWGVCWMFIAGYGAPRWMPREVAQSRHLSEAFRTRHAPSPTTSPQNAGTWATAGINTTTPSAPAQWLQLPAENDTRLCQRANDRGSDYQSTLPDQYAASAPPFSYIFHPTASSDRFSDPLNTQPDNQGSNTFFPTFSPDYTIDTDWPSISQSQAFSSGRETTESGRQIGYIELNVPSNRQGMPILHSRGDVSHPSGLQLPGGEMQGYPSPGSDYSRQTRLSCPTVSPHIPVSRDMPSEASPSTETSPSIRQDETRKSLEPTKNAEGRIYCAHRSCAGQPPIFARKCEWSKHMDKHNRPYVCEEDGCEKIQGFTYSGGLLRHQREVHRQHGGPKASCVCPYRDCKRSTGAGFSRKENLSEHLRRVHRGVGDLDKAAIAEVSYPSADQQAVAPMTSESRKRKKSLGYAEDERDSLQESQKRRRCQNNDTVIHRDPLGQPPNLQQQVDHLKRELHMCQDNIKRLEQIVEQMARAQHVRL